MIEGEISNELWGIYYDDNEVAQVTFIIGTLDVRGHEIDDVNIVAIENKESGKEYDVSTLLKITVKACEDEYYGLDWDEEESDE